jgi:Tfp pilus assembly major pilin PilA
MDVFNKLRGGYMKKNIVNKQQGMTFIGLVLVIATIIFLAVIGMKVVPAYIEFFGVKKIIKSISNDPKFNEMSKQDIITSFDKGANIGYVSVIKGSDLVIAKGDSGNVVSATYQVTVPIVANASVLLDFNISTAK